MDTQTIDKVRNEILAKQLSSINAQKDLNKQIDEHQKIISETFSELNALRVVENKYYNTMDQNKLKFLQQNISRAKSRGNKSWPMEITKYMAYEVGESQNWKCAITGVELEFTRGGTYFRNMWCNPNSCVIDRIDSSKGYTKDNIQLLTHKANMWKSDFSNEELKQLCEQFLSTHTKKA